MIKEIKRQLLFASWKEYRQ